MATCKGCGAPFLRGRRVMLQALDGPSLTPVIVCGRCADRSVRILAPMVAGPVVIKQVADPQLGAIKGALERFRKMPTSDTGTLRHAGKLEGLDIAVALIEAAIEGRTVT